MRPYIVKEIVSAEGETVHSFEPQVVGQPVSQETSAAIRQILETVVEEGGGRNAYIPGYRIGGKTGTAQKYDASGRIMNDVHVSSFIGFAPMDDPQVAVLFVVDEPGLQSDYGSTVAAPYARKILENTLQHLGVQPVYADGEQPSLGVVSVPDVLGMRSSLGQEALQEAGLRYILDGVEGYEITDQSPKAGAMVPEQSIVMLYTDLPAENEPSDAQHVIVPDVLNMSVIEANRTMTHSGLVMRIKGSGLAVSQSPAAGTEVEGGSSVSVTFETP